MCFCFIPAPLWELEECQADVGTACGKGKGAIFRKGKVVSTVREENLLEALMAEINFLSLDGRGSV